VTAWFERRAGSEETLLALYDAVQAAEELDLEEQAHDERFWAELQDLYDWPLDEADVTMVTADPHDEIDEVSRLTMGQAVGIVEHLLGGRPWHDGGPSTS
jgi:hypothetical protein